MVLARQVCQMINLADGGFLTESHDLRQGPDRVPRLPLHESKIYCLAESGKRSAERLNHIDIMAEFD